MTSPPPSIPAKIQRLEDRMQRIEDAITAKGIKFIDTRKNYDWMPVSEVMNYVYEIKNIRRKWRTAYHWIHLGLRGKHGKRVYLKYETFTFRMWYTRKLWVNQFLEEL